MRQGEFVPERTQQALVDDVSRVVELVMADHEHAQLSVRDGRGRIRLGLGW